MPEGVPAVAGLLALGYILIFLEIFLPGGVLGVLGGLAILYGCYLAFGLSAGWGVASIGLSVIVTLLAVRFFVRSRIARKLVLEDRGAGSWKATEGGLEGLLGAEGRTLSALRPAGLVEIGDQRVDVVADSEFLDAGVAVRVCEVEGNRVVVEAVESEA